MNHRTAFFVIISVVVGACSDHVPANAPAMDRSLPRLAVHTTVDAEVSSVSDFIRAEGSLYVLDWREHRVAQLASRDGAWRPIRYFSRNGQGPGEIKEPVSLAFNDSTRFLEILERSGEIEIFDTAGTYVRSEKVELPCPSVRMQLAIAHGQRFVGERCLGIYANSLADDTLFMLFAAVFPGHPADLLLHQATSTKDGSWGSIYTATWPFSLARDTVLFGGGVDTCTWLVPLPRAVQANRDCDDDARRYSVAPPKEFANPSRQRSADWPRPLPYFAGSSSSVNDWLLARFVSADSIGFETMHAPRRLVLIAPLNSFVGCKNAVCLWYADDERGGRLDLFDMAR